MSLQRFLIVYMLYCSVRVCVWGHEQELLMIFKNILKHTQINHIIAGFVGRFFTFVWEKPYLCRHCDKCFLICNIIPTGEKPYIFIPCCKALHFSHKYYSNIIMLWEKPYLCRHCDKDFWMCNIIHTGEKP